MSDLHQMREDIKAYTDSVDREVLSPTATNSLSVEDRLRIAIRVAAVNGHNALLEQYERELDALIGQDASACVVDVDRWSELPPKVRALLEHCEQVALDPMDLGEHDVKDLESLGITAKEIVTATQVVAYVSYRVRLLTGLEAMAEAAAQATPLPQIPTRPAAVNTGLPSPAETFPAYKWRPWVEAPEPPQKQAGVDEKTPSKWSPFYLTLLHDERVLEERTALYDAIMTGTGQLDRADRELAALATSLTTGCEYCASVHGRRQVQLSKDKVTAVALALRGKDSLNEAKQFAIASIAAKVAVTPPSVGADDVQHLRAVGLDDGSIREFFAVTAMFAWANRLMMTLGEAAKD